MTKHKDNRELFGRILQCRTGHAYTGEFRRRFNMEGTYSCPCGEDLESREHILRTCPRYEPYRYHLEKVSPDIWLADILGSKEGLDALAIFINMSGALTRTGKTAPEPKAPDFEDEPVPPDED